MGLIMLKKYIGTKEFYKYVLSLTLPIMVQNFITNFVSMLDNIMVGRLNTPQMTGVAIANQLIFVFNLCIFGALSGAGIFGAQFFGSGDMKGVRSIFRFKIVFCTLLTIVCIAVFYFFDEPLIGLYLHGEGNPVEIAETLSYARAYMRVMLVGLVPYTLAQCYGSTLRESGRPVLPMLAGIAAVCVNLGLNYVLIFGHFGAPALGAKGAAIATVISRFAEVLIIIVIAKVRKDEAPFLEGVFHTLRVPAKLVRQIFVKGLPLMLNEALWAVGVATLNQCYSVISVDVVTANNINQTFFNVFSVAFMAVGVAIGIIVGQVLGARDDEKAYDYARKLIAFSVMVGTVVGALFIVSAEVIPQFYNTTETIQRMATSLMIITALAMPVDAFVHATYFTLRSGGKVIVTMLFDSVFMCCVCVPVAFLLTRLTSISILPLYAICQALNLIKCVLGFILVRKRIWVRNIVLEA